MVKVFIDTNVLLDHLLDRIPFSDDASTIINLAETKRIKLYTSSLSFMNAFYVTKKLIGNHKALQALALLEKVIELLDLTQNHIHEALKKSYKDFEDGVQMEVVALSKKPDFIVTRDLKDFKQATIPVLTPSDFLQSF